MKKIILKSKKFFLGLAISIGIFYAKVSLIAATPTASMWNPDELDATNLPSSTIMGIVVNVMNWLLIAIGIAGVVGFAIAGIFYLTSAGNDDQIKQAKKAMQFSILGVIVALAGVVALQAAYAFLSGEIF